MSSAVPSLNKFLQIDDDEAPGEVSFGSGIISLNPGRKAVSLSVINTGDRPIQVPTFHLLVIVKYLRYLLII